MNAKIKYNMECMFNIHKSQNEKFKAKAYNDALIKLNSYDKEIDSIVDIDDFKFGKSIKEKVMFIITNNENLPQIENNDLLMKRSALINELSSVHNIGVVKANQLVEKHNIISLDDLKKRTHLLNAKQIQGLTYHEHIQKQIPRDEMDLHNVFIKSVFSESFSEIKNFSLVGSYRRCADESGDIDLIVSTNTNVQMTDLVNTMKTYILKDGVFAFGKKKFMGMCKLPNHQIARRLDILFCAPLEYPYALLYFTGSRDFNIKMRDYAKQMGFTLNEKGLWKDNTKLKLTTQTERAIFDYLNVKYLDPIDRLSNGFEINKPNN